MDQEKTYKWIQDRIRDLHAGKLSAADRVRMEELAKEDPFVKDALEGYQTNPDHDHSVLLKVIADRIQHKNESRRPKILPLSKGWVIPAVAASLVLILATWVVMFYIEKQGDAVFVAAEPETGTSIEHSTEVRLSDADSLTGDISSASSSVAGNNNGSTGLKEDARSESRSTFAIKESARKNKNEPDDKSQPADDLKKTEEILADKYGKEKTDELSTGAAVSSPAPPTTQPPGRSAVEMSADKSMAAGATEFSFKSKKDEGYYANQISPEMMSKRVSGVVTNRQGEIIIGAIISVKNTNLLTSTDGKGKFELFIPEQITNIDVSISGYRDTTLAVSQGEEDLIIMLNQKEYNAPADIVLGSESRQQLTDIKTKTSDSSPPDYIMFSAYVKENSHYPVQDYFTATNKEVIVSFKVSKYGRPDIIQKISSSADPKYSAEALRLLKHGPDWQYAGDVYPCDREYTIYFK